MTAINRKENPMVTKIVEKERRAMAQKVTRQPDCDPDRHRLKPGERLSFHTHVLDYFWSSVTGGHGSLALQ